MSREGCKALAASESLQNLQGLFLERNPIGDDGCKELARSKHLRNLEKLNISRYGVEIKGFEAIVYSATLPKKIRRFFEDQIQRRDFMNTAQMYGIGPESKLMKKAELVEWIRETKMKYAQK